MKKTQKSGAKQFTKSINININVNATESQPPPVVIKRFVNPLIILSPIVDQQQSNVRDYEYIS